MSSGSGLPPANTGLARLTSGAVRQLIEQQVSAYLGRAWRATTVVDCTPMASHPAATFSDGQFAVFVKRGQSDAALDQFEKEAAGLRLLTQRAGVLTPTVIASLAVTDGALIIMEAVPVVERQIVHWRQFGQTLAHLHCVKGQSFGLVTDAYWGDLFQDNSPLEDWPDFFWQRRLAPRLRAAVDSGHLPGPVAAQVEKLRRRLPELCGPVVTPTLLHGDAHQNNFLSTAQGPVLIDPAVYYGHPEIDLAYVDFFQPVPDELFRAYAEAAPLDPGFRERRELWRLPFWLAMVEVDGPRQLGGLLAGL